MECGVADVKAIWLMMFVHVCGRRSERRSQVKSTEQSSEPNMRKERLGYEEGRSDPAASKASSLTKRSKLRAPTNESNVQIPMHVSSESAGISYGHGLALALAPLKAVHERHNHRREFYAQVPL